VSALALAGRPEPAPAQRAASADALLAADLLSHLASQIGSAERLLCIVLEQGAAIRRREVHEVVRLAGLLHGEMSRRGQIEQERSELLARAGLRLGVPPEAVTITRLSALLGPESAAQAQVRSAQLSGMLRELQREHLLNRALMKVELSFLDHLMKTLALDGGPIYDSTGAGASRARTDPTAGLRLLDLEA
jgi:hypothetical protein